MKKGLLAYFLYVVLGVSLIATVATPILSMRKVQIASKSFNSDGYILAAPFNSVSDEINTQYYFSSGTQYKDNLDNKISFVDINGERVSTDKTIFVHYQDGNLSALNHSVILDTDNLTLDGSTSYYQVSSDIVLSKNGSNYIFNNAGSDVTLTNFFWKIDNNKYMAVSPTIKLVSGEDEQIFDGFVELRYIDEGVVHLVTQEGTYSTISSNAYLEFENGIKTFIGSKNVSDENQVLVNLGEMVVDTDADVEKNPDSDYTIEKTEEAKVVVNVAPGTSGEDGDRGSVGVNGVNGDNGKNGAPGEKGDSGETGAQGDSSPTAGATYEKDAIPLFQNENISTTPYSVTINSIDFDSNECLVTKKWISITELSSGNQIWVKDISNISTTTITDISCNILAASTNYTICFGVTYTNANILEPVSQIVYTIPFTTDDFTIALDFDYATYNLVGFKLKSSGPEQLLSQIKINFFADNNPNFFYQTYVVNQEKATEMGYDKNTYQFDVSSLTGGDSIDVAATGLMSNSTYYAQICPISMASSTDPLIPLRSFPKIKVLTAKKDPVINNPTGYYSEFDQAFTITNGSITDPDNGIVSYRYDLFKAEDITNPDAIPVFSVTRTENRSVNIDVDDVTVFREVEYVAKTTVLFNNNYDNIEYSSGFSDVFCAGKDSWPTVNVSVVSGTQIGSVCDIKIIITDTSRTMNDSAIVSVAYQTTLPTDVVSDQTQRQRDIKLGDYQLASFTKSELKSGGVQYIKTASIKSLKADFQSYSFSVTISQFIANGEVHNNQTLRNVEIITGTYSPLFVNKINAPSNGNDSFRFALVFSPSNTELENLRRGTSDDNGINLEYMNTGTQKTVTHIVDGEPVSQTIDANNLGDLSIKSMSQIVLSIYPAANNEKDPSKSVPDTSRELWTYTINEDGVASYNNKKKEYASTYDFNSSFFSDAYTLKYEVADDSDDVTNETCTSIPYFSDKFNLFVSSSDFGSNGESVVDRYPLGSTFFIKVSAYDYTYGGGGDYRVNGDSNIIPIGTETTFKSGSLEDAWIQVKTDFIVPSIPTTTYCENACLILKDKVTENIEEYSDYYYYQNKVSDHPNNLVNITSINGSSSSSSTYNTYINSTILKNSKDSSVAGLTYKGPTALLKYISRTDPSVMYLVYKRILKNEFVGVPENELTDDSYDYRYITASEWLMVDGGENAKELPTWTFFLGVADDRESLEIMPIGEDRSEPMVVNFYKDKVTNLPYVANRAEEFFVETRVKLNTKLDLVYPNDYYETNGKRVTERYLITQQNPELFLMPYDVNNDSENSVYLLDVYDDDEVVFKSNVDQKRYQIYDSNNSEKTSTSSRSDDTIIDNITYGSLTSDGFSYSLSYSNSNSHPVRYAYKEIYSDIIPATTTEPQKNISKSRTVYKNLEYETELNIVPKSDFDVLKTDPDYIASNPGDPATKSGLHAEYDEEKRELKVTLCYKTSDKVYSGTNYKSQVVNESNKNIIRIDLKLVNPNSTVEPYVYRIPNADLISTALLYDDNGSSAKGYFRQEINIPVKDFFSILSQDDITKLRLSVDVYQDSGKYGLKYLTYNDSKKLSDVPDNEYQYYAIQYNRPISNKRIDLYSTNNDGSFVFNALDCTDNISRLRMKKAASIGAEDTTYTIYSYPSGSTISGPQFMLSPGSGLYYEKDNEYVIIKGVEKHEYIEDIPAEVEKVPPVLSFKITPEFTSCQFKFDLAEETTQSINNDVVIAISQNSNFVVNTDLTSDDPNVILYRFPYVTPTNNGGKYIASYECNAAYKEEAGIMISPALTPNTDYYFQILLPYEINDSLDSTNVPYYTTTTSYEKRNYNNEPRYADSANGLSIKYYPIFTKERDNHFQTLKEYLYEEGTLSPFASSISTTTNNRDDKIATYSFTMSYVHDATLCEMLSEIRFAFYKYDEANDDVKFMTTHSNNGNLFVANVLGAIGPYCTITKKQVWNMDGITTTDDVDVISIPITQDIVNQIFTEDPSLSKGYGSITVTIDFPFEPSSNGDHSIGALDSIYGVYVEYIYRDDAFVAENKCKYDTKTVSDFSSFVHNSTVPFSYNFVIDTYCDDDLDNVYIEYKISNSDPFALISRTGSRNSNKIRSKIELFAKNGETSTLVQTKYIVADVLPNGETGYFRDINDITETDTSVIFDNLQLGTIYSAKIYYIFDENNYDLLDTGTDDVFNALYDLPSRETRFNNTISITNMTYVVLDNGHLGIIVTGRNIDFINKCVYSLSLNGVTIADNVTIGKLEEYLNKESIGLIDVGVKAKIGDVVAASLSFFKDSSSSKADAQYSMSGAVSSIK